MNAVGRLQADLQARIERVRSGVLPRRRFIAQLAARGVAAPVASLLLLDAGIAQTPRSTAAWTPTKRGGGGTLKLLFWQGPTLLNPHFANGAKDAEAARLFYEPLVQWDADANLTPLLAAELPSKVNGGIAADGKSVVWKLKPGVTWHDGKPFTADDVVFNWQYASNPATAALTIGAYLGVKFEKVDALTVRVLFDKPSPFWPGAYSQVRLVPKHLFEAYAGAASRDAPANLKPVGTGPYTFVDFKPGDLVTAVLNGSYHMPNKPFFDRVELKGGGDAVSAARAVLQTGEYDYAWQLQVEDEILQRLEAGGKGRVEFLTSGSAEMVYLNFTDPAVETDGERASPKSRHPLLADPAVRKALALLVDRPGIQRYIYGRSGIATPNVLNNPPRYRSSARPLEFNVDKASALLDAAGWKPGADGIRAKAGKKLAFVYQTSTNPLRQKTQGIVKQAAQKAGIAVELKTVTPSVFFSSDVANPDTTGKFWADIQMYTAEQGSPDPQRHLQRFVSWEASCKANKWLGLNVTRWRNDAYDAAFKAAELELDPVKRTALLIRMNDLVCGDGYVLPLVYRPDVVAVSRTLVANLSGWDRHLGSIHDWHRAA